MTDGSGFSAVARDSSSGNGSTSFMVLRWGVAGEPGTENLCRFEGFCSNVYRSLPSALVGPIGDHCDVRGDGRTMLA